MRIHHAAITVNNLEESQKFYQDFCLSPFVEILCGLTTKEIHKITFLGII